MANANPQVIVYSTQSCPYCVQAKRYLEEQGVKFEVRDVGADKKAAFEMFQKSGQMGVPVLDVNGTIIVGFDRMALHIALLTVKKG